MGKRGDTSKSALFYFGRISSIGERFMTALKVKYWGRMIIKDSFPLCWNRSYWKDRRKQSEYFVYKNEE